MDIFLNRAYNMLSSRLCSSCRRALKPSRTRLSLQNSDRIQLHRRSRGNIASAGEQAHALTGFYADILDKPLRAIQPATRTQPKPAPTDELPRNEKEETLQKARIVFGSRLAGPLERAEQLRRDSIEIAGILVPPRPSEPDNCCMSGCVNCVWDQYRDELEEWAAKSAEARMKLQTKKESGVGTSQVAAVSGTTSHVAISMDDDGGGSETNWSASDPPPADLFSDIPIGIREFMKTEKMLKQKYRQEGTVGR